MARHPNRTRTNWYLPLSALLIVAAALLLASCGSRQIGFGVLLWSPMEETLVSGSVVSVTDESDLNDTYTIEDALLESPVTLERWRVDFYETEEEAVAAAESYASQLDGNTRLYARAGRNALPMRSEPDSLGNNIVYRLREDEVVKLIGRQSEQTDLEGLVSYWYEALTATGVRAWVFGYTLSVYDPLDEAVVIDSGPGADPLVELLLNNVWRPIYYLDMIANGAIDLDLFKAEYGLFPDPEHHQLELVLRRHTTIFEYDDIVNVGPRKYLAEGTSLQITFQRNDELSIQYLLDGEQYLLAMQRVPGDVQEYIDAEVERREVEYDRVLEHGPSFASDNYGELEFLPDNRFTWTGYSRLVPVAIPEGSGANGTVDLGLFLTAELMRSYDGALTFRFSANRAAASFMYTFRNDGIRLVYVPQTDITDRLVQRQSRNPLTLFFSISGP